MDFNVLSNSLEEESDKFEFGLDIIEINNEMRENIGHPAFVIENENV